MKYEKAMVKVINLGNEDILTCSTDNGHSNWPTTTTTGSNKKKKGWFWGWGGWGWPWGGWWF